MARPKHGRRNQRGFAMLLVFLMASIVAITLYMEVPRVAMESERAKEQLLIDRGEQYKRAIQLFTKKAGRYPARIEELESFQNLRFLRKRYIDPITGKDEWRVVHIQNGVLTDSKVSAPQKQGEEKKDNGSFAGIENSFGTGVNNGPQGGGQLVRERRRASESGTAGTGPELPPTQSSPTQLAGPPGSTPPADGQPNTGQAGQPTPGQPNSGQPNSGQPGPPQVAANTGQLPLPGQVPGGGRTGQGQMPGMPGMNPANSNSSGGSSFGGSTNSFGGGTSITPQPGQAVYNGQQPGQTGAAAGPFGAATGGGATPPGAATTPQGQNNAADMINRILTSPRPGGPPSPVTGGAGLGSGIAGFASNGEGDTIMVYNDRTAYQEWEFIFDPQKQKQIPNPNTGGAGGTPAQQMGSQTGPTGGSPPFGSGGGGIGQTPGGITPSSSSSGSNSFGGSNSFNMPATNTPATNTPATTPPPTKQE